MKERPSARLRAKNAAALMCPLCREGLAPDAIPCDACEGCGTQVHADCGRELGGCPTQGCAKRGQSPPPAPAALETKRAALVQDHERMLARFRRLRDAHREDRRWVDVGMAMRLIGLVAVGLGAWWLLHDGHGQLAIPAFLWGAALFAIANRLDRH